MDWNFYQPSLEGDGARHLDRQHEPVRPVIALMGTTGAGKTYFASRATGQDLHMERSLDYGPRMLEYEFRHRGLDMDVILIDTPGFDDPNKSDHVLLGECFEYFQNLSSRGLSLWGIIYFHRINDTRMYGSAQRTLQLLTMIMGDQYLRNVRLCTTMWNEVDNDLGESREKQLKMKFWTELICKGAQVERFNSKPHSARMIIEKLVRNVLFPDTTNESHFNEPSDRRPLSETEEGRLALRSLDDTLQELQESLQAIQRQLTEPGFNNFGFQPDPTELSTQERVLEGQIRIVEGLKNTFLNPGSHHSNSPDAGLFSRLSLANPTDPENLSFSINNDPRASWDDSAAPQPDTRNRRMERPSVRKGSSALDQGRNLEPPLRKRNLESPRLASLGSEEHIEAGAYRQLPEHLRGVDHDFARNRNR